MSRTSYIRQPFDGGAGKVLIQQLENGDFAELNMAVAFAKQSGVLRVKHAIEKFRERGGKVSAFIGIDLDGTSYEALELLYWMVDDLYVLHLEDDQTFHPKFYYFEGPDSSLAITGSSNLTLGGLWKNFELCSVIEYDNDDQSDLFAREQARAYFKLLRGVEGMALKIDAISELDRLQNEGYLKNELSILKNRKSASRANRKKSDKLDRMFASRFVANYPKLDAHPSNDARDERGLPKERVHQARKKNHLVRELQTFWFESKKMTGGSCNQLDLSMTALLKSGDPSGTEFETDIPNSMKGGLYFFGIDSETSPTKGNMISILYGGKDYIDNEIKLYSKGSNPNGTWRINLQGRTNEGRSLIEQLRIVYPDVKYPLQHKVLAFEKISEGYYSLTIFNEDELDEFIEVSELVAYNGTSKTARLVGVF